MVDRPVTFIVDVEGGGEAQKEFEDTTIKLQEATEQTALLTGKLRELQKAEGDNSKAVDAMRREVIRATQAQERLKAEIGGSSIEAIAFQAKAQALGSTIGQVGAVVARINPEFARWGAVIGGIGAQIPALTGSLGPVAQGIAAITIAVDLGTTAWEAWTGETEAAARAADATKRQVTDLANSLTQLHQRQMEIAGAGALAPIQARFDELDAAAQSSQEVADRARATAITRQTRDEGRIAELRIEQAENAGRIARINALGGIQAADVAGQAIERMEGSIRRRATDVRNLQETAARQQAEFEVAEAALITARARRQGGLGEIETPDSGRGGGGGGAAREAEREAEARQRAILETRQIEAEGIRALSELTAREEQFRRDEFDRTAMFRQSLDEAAMERQRLLGIAAVETAEKEREILEQAMAESRRANADLRADVESTIGPMLQGFTSALSSIVAGAESADQAFQGLLAAFLEMLAQQAALEAAKNFAMAISDFASLNPASGALHLAAGAAWTVIAVAAGAGSIAAAPAEAVPTSPEAAADTGGGAGGGTNVLNINGTIISADGAGDRARAGREVGALVREGTRRFGRAG